MLKILIEKIFVWEINKPKILVLKLLILKMLMLKYLY